MLSQSFRDANGVPWMVLPGLPAEHPDADVHRPFAGLTFHANTGEVRVLPLREIPRAHSADFDPLPWSAGDRMRQSPKLDYASLLARATPWPNSAT